MYPKTPHSRRTVVLRQRVYTVYPGAGDPFNGLDCSVHGHISEEGFYIKTFLFGPCNITTTDSGVRKYYRKTKLSATSRNRSYNHVLTDVCIYDEDIIETCQTRYSFLFIPYIHI